MRRAVAIALLVVCLVLMTLYNREGYDGPLHRIQQGVQGVTAPLSVAGAALDAGLEDAADSAADAQASEETLSALRAQNEQLRNALAQSEEYRLENERLRQLLDLKEAYSIQGVTGQVIGRSTDAWNQSVTVDVGSDDGVEAGMTVMAAEGVIGQVVSVEGGSCTVRLLTDPQSGAAAMIQSSRAEGIVRGSLDGLLYLENLGADVAVQTGDLVITSGLGGSYMRGLLIGTVVRITGNAGDASRRIVVAPNATASALEEVMVVFDATAPAAYDGGSGANVPADGAEGGAASNEPASDPEGGNE